MKRAIIAGAALLASSFTPIEPGFVALAGQPATSPPTSPAPLPPTYPPEWECPAAALGPPENGARFGTPFVVAGQGINFTADFTVVPIDDEIRWVLASLEVHSPVKVRCPIVNSQNVLTHDVTVWVSPGNTILMWVCLPELTVPGQQLTKGGDIPEEILQGNCGAAGSFDNRRVKI